MVHAPAALVCGRLLNFSAALAGSEPTLRLLYGAKRACSGAIATFKNTRLFFSGRIVAQLPQEFLEGMVEFAAGLRPWSVWRWWFNVHAGRLVRLVERRRFQQLKDDPQAAVVTDEAAGVKRTLLHASLMPRSVLADAETTVGCQTPRRPMRASMTIQVSPKRCWRSPMR